MGKSADKLRREAVLLKRNAATLRRQVFLMKRQAAERAKAEAALKPSPRPMPRITPDHLARSRAGSAPSAEVLAAMFAAAAPAPGVVPKDKQTLAMDEAITKSVRWAAGAMDQQIILAGGWVGAFGGWGGQGYGPFSQGLQFMGYPYLSELALRAEYRVITECTATEMTRKGIEITVAGDAGGKSKNVDQLEKELERLQAMEMCCKAVEGDGYMGRSHLYLDYLGAEDDDDERRTPIGDGRNKITQLKVQRGQLQRIQPVEAVWTYPANYNSTNPLRPDWYHPERWFVMGKEVHASRLLTYVGREVPDLLKPAFAFGGLSMSQMAKPTVDNWLRTRQSVSDLLHSFSVFRLSTDLSAALEPGGNVQFDARMQLFNNVRDNKGLFVVNKETEEFGNVSVPLGSLDTLQAQAQEHMCSVSRTPVVKLLGLSPHGLNASSEGELRTFYDFIAANQIKFLKPNLDRIFALAQVNLWGAVDPALGYKFVPLWSLSEKEEAEVRKIEAETDDILTTLGAVDNVEVRRRVATDPNTPYQGLDLKKVIVAPQMGGGGAGGLENLHNAGEGGSGGGEFQSEAA